VNADFILDYFDTLASTTSVKDGPVRILVAARFGDKTWPQDLATRLGKSKMPPSEWIRLRIVTASSL
jgi:hypothetical protein